VIVHSARGQWTDVVQKAPAFAAEFRIGGSPPTIPFLAAILAHPDFCRPTMSAPVIDRMPQRWLLRQRKPRRRTLLGRCRSAPRNGAPKAEYRDRPGRFGCHPAPLQGTIVAIEVREGTSCPPAKQIRPCSNP